MTDAIQDYINHVYGINDSIIALIKKLQGDGFIRFKIRTGCLLDDMLYIHPLTIDAYKDGTHNPKWIFVFKEVPTGSQSSRYTVIRHKKVKKYMLKFLEE